MRFIISRKKAIHGKRVKMREMMESAHRTMNTNIVNMFKVFR